MIASAYVVWATIEREQGVAYRQVQRWARTLADNQVQMVASARALLTALAHTAAVRRGGDADACRRLAAELQTSFPQYANIGVIENDGRVSCSALPAQDVDLSDRAYFQQAKTLRTFVGGDYQIGRITRKATINYALPVLSEDGQVLRVVFAAIDLNWLAQWSARAGVPPGTALLLVDTAGVVVFRYPEGARYMGRQLRSGELGAALPAAGREGRTRALGLDSVQRLYSFVPVPPTGRSAPFRFVVGVPEAQVFAFSYQLGRRAFVFIFLLVGGALAIAWLLSERIIMRRIEAIYDATRRLTAGDLSARTGIDRGSDELAALAHSFDAMAATLEQNHRLLERNERNTRFLADASRVLASSLDYERTLRTLAELSVARFADWCSIDLRMDPSGRDRFRYVHHADPEKREQAAELARNTDADEANERVPANRVFRTGEPILIRRVDKDLLAQGAGDERQYRLLRALGLHSAMVVPLRVATETLGVLTLVSAEGEREFDETDLQLAVELGRRAALAVENARLYAELEQRVQARTRELVAVNHELEAFSYSVSHDLRSPLRSLDGFSQALAEDYEDVLDDTGRDYLRRIRAAAQRMGALIDDLLGLARVTRAELKRSAVNLSEIAQSVVQELEQSDPGRNMRVTIEPALRTYADPGLCRVLLQNLVGNAWKFTARTDEPALEIGSETTDEETVYYVRDNGIGFDMAYADKLFGAFQRLHGMNEFAGTGIGLATVQRIVTRHGGSVWAESAPNLGATFYFTLGRA